MRHCPDCGETINPDARRCACGWVKQGVAGFDPDRHKCCDIYKGQKCASAGSISTSTQGGGPWYCHQHFPAFRGIAAVKSLPSAGFQSLKAILPRVVDPEADAERLAIQAE